MNFCILVFLLQRQWSVHLSMLNFIASLNYANTLQLQKFIGNLVLHIPIPPPVIFPSNCGVSNNTRISFHDTPRSGRPRTSRTDSNAQLIKTLIDANPRHSSRSLSIATGISKDTAITILREDLRMRKL